MVAIVAAVAAVAVVAAVAAVAVAADDDDAAQREQHGVVGPRCCISNTVPTTSTYARLSPERRWLVLPLV